MDRARLADVENHADRPEVQGAINGTVSFAQRTSATIGEPLLYGAMQIEAQSVSPGEVAREAWAHYADQAALRDISFEVGGDAQVRADPQDLDQILRNLLENALRHTGDGGHVRVIVAEGDSGLVRIDVSDNGEGIPSESLSRIFERFFRADSARARDVGGTGLGLAIVRHLGSVMGGNVEAESELGRGTTISFTLPGE